MNKISIIVVLAITIVITIGMIEPFTEKWNTGWDLDKDKVCVPYLASGIVEMYEGDEHCTIKQRDERKEFLEYYCVNYNCKPVFKTEKQLKVVYEDWLKQPKVIKDD